MLKKLTFSFSVVLLFLNSSKCYADTTNVFYIRQSIARFFNLPQSARSLGMGGTEVPITFDNNSIFGNPAGLGFMKNAQLSGTLGHNRHIGSEFLTKEDIVEDDPNGSVLFSYPLNKGDKDPARYGVIGAGYSRYNGSTNDSINTKNDGHTRSIAYGTAVNEKVSIGYGLTFFDDQLRSDLADYHAHARFRHSLGTQYHITPDINVGLLVFYGLGQSDFEEFSVQSNGLTHQKQWSGDLGASYKINNTVLNASINYDHYSASGNVPVQSRLIVIGDDEAGATTGFHFGVEQSVTSSFDLRAGYHLQEVNGYHYQRSDIKILNGGLHLNAFSIGAGYAFSDCLGFLSKIQIDYGLQYGIAGKGEWEHLLSAGIYF